MKPREKPMQRAVVSTSAANAVMAVLSFATGILAARLLGADGRGHLAAAQAIGGLVGLLGSLSIGESLVYFVASKRTNPPTALATSTAVALAGTAVAGAVAWVAMPWFLSGAPEAVSAARLYALVGFTFVLLGFPITLQRSLQRFDEWNLLRLISPVAWLIALLVLAVTSSRSPATLVALFLMLQALAIPYVWWRARLRSPRRFRVDRRLIRPMLRFGAPVFLASLPLTLNVRFDQILLANTSTARELGMYAVSVSWSGLCLPLMTSIGAVLFPALASTDGGSSARDLLVRSARVATTIGAAAAVGLAIAGPLAIGVIFGDEFRPTMLLSVLLAVSSVILGLVGVLEDGLRGLDQTVVIMWSEFAGLAVTIVVLFALVPVIGTTGAGVASLLGYSTVLTIAAFRLSSSLRTPVRAFFAPDRHLFGAAVRLLSRSRG